MKVAMICFTARGADTAARIREALENGKIQEAGNAVAKKAAFVRIWCAKAGFLPGNRIELLQEPLRCWTENAFGAYDALVFVGATGIAVRSIAPFLKSKMSDPAVLCVDELGKFVIPLVSGHVGGANGLAARLAKELEAVPVITTATDLNGRFAVDVFAGKNHLWISDRKLAKRISADVLDGKKIGFLSDFPVSGRVPEDLELWDPGRLPGSGRSIWVSLDEKREFRDQTLALIPRIVSIGVGCKKETAFSVIEERICTILRACGVSIHSVEYLASIDRKAREPGLCEFARKYGIEFVTCTPQELEAAQGEFEESAFVASVTGVSNVCERSAVLAAGRRGPAEDAGIGEKKAASEGAGRLIQKKTAKDGVTVALAVRDWGVRFE